MALGPEWQPENADPQAGLLRQLGFFSATALVISNMVGTGIFAPPVSWRATWAAPA